MASTDRTNAEVTSNEPPNKRLKMEGLVSEQAVKALVEHYRLNEYQERRLKFVANSTKFVPTVDEVEWVVEEAKLREGNKDLDFFMFPFMEYYAWYFRSKDEDFRLYIGGFVRYDGVTWPVWMRFAQTVNGHKTSLHLDGPEEDVEGQTGVLNLPEYRRLYITWWEPFDHLFQLANMSPEDPDETSKAKIAASLQDDYFRATVKVLARFPGLIPERDPDDETKRRQVYSDFSTSPFLHAEAFSPANPLAKLFDMLCAKKTSSVRETKFQEKAEVREGEATMKTTRMMEVKMKLEMKLNATQSSRSDMERRFGLDAWRRWPRFSGNQALCGHESFLNGDSLEIGDTIRYDSKC